MTYGWYLVIVSLHVLAATVWVGGMVFLGVAVVPVLRAPDLAPVRTTLLHRLGLRFRWVGWALLGVLVGTGLLLLHAHGYTWAHLWNGTLWQGPWGHALAWKLGFVGLVLVANAVHDFYLGPRAMKQIEADEATAAPTRRAASYLGRLTAVASIIIVILAVILARGGL
ncbi:DUF4149 domain-containing protein [Salisaeta longa]|uniref:DUF4149 domain-containing protein n=1 Tax=Salisaeta longa TaxID=503170 RepID=UPI0003B2F923|nr:DUF4149 domain-containing protein [Salisaeta longa]